MKASAICCGRLGFALDIWNLMRFLDIQMETSVRMMDRSLKDEGKGHVVAEYFRVTRGLCKLLRKYFNLYIPGEEALIFLWSIYAMFLCTPSLMHSLYLVY